MGELLTKLTVWLAVCAYAAGAVMIARGRGRGVWTLGCILFLAHVVCAFSYYHHWSHADAYAETALQTEAMTGVHTGGGLFLNYVFGAAWLGDVLWWRLAAQAHGRRPRWIHVTLHAFMFFMVLNGAVVFAHGPLRWLGLALCLVVAMGWLRNGPLLRQKKTPLDAGG